MTEPHPDPRTPGRRQTLGSKLAEADLVRRLQALSLPADHLPRVVRFIQAEVAEALTRQARDLFSPDELKAAGAKPKLINGLREERARRDQLEAIRAAGLHRLSSTELEAVLADANAEGE